MPTPTMPMTMMNDGQSMTVQGSLVDKPNVPKILILGKAKTVFTSWTWAIYILDSLFGLNPDEEPVTGVLCSC